MHVFVRALVAAAPFALGCTQSVTALESIDASVDSVTVPDGGVIANVCAHPELFDGMLLALTVTGIQRTTPICTSFGCRADAGGADADVGVGGCCNTCDAYWLLPCVGGGGLVLRQGTTGFRCTGSECSLRCDPELMSSDTITFDATIHVGGPAGTDARATLDFVDYTRTTLPDS